MRKLIFGIALICGICTSKVAAEETLPVTDQFALNAMNAKDPLAAFLFAFEAGDELTEFSFTQDRGVGAYLGDGRIFTRVPRADLGGDWEWANHFPKREGGPNATSCIACHNAPFANGAGDVALNVILDPDHTGKPWLYLERNTLPLFALGVPQRLAEEMTTALHLQREDVKRRACRKGQASTDLSAKGVSFDTLSATKSTQSAGCEVNWDTRWVKGVDTDLVVRPFGWKGNEATIRAFTRNAAHNEMGLQAVELVGDKDGDFDGVTSELSIGDMTALTVYMAGLERPVSKLELDKLGLEKLERSERRAIQRGENLFDDIGCASCHVPTMTLDDPIYREPSRTAGYFDETLPSGQAPSMMGLTNATAIAFDLSRDQPNNRVMVNGQEVRLGALTPTAQGGAVATWYTDFKRHDIGFGLADPDNPLGIGASEFLTRSLAGVGSTGPWLHDGRATTLMDAINWHGGEATQAQLAYGALPAEDKADIIAFLENLIIYKSAEEEEE